MSESMSCPICLNAATSLPAVGPDSGHRAATHYECRRCGLFTITFELSQWWRGARERNDGRLQQADEQLLPYVSAHTRQALDPVELTTNNWQELARQHTNTPFSRKRDRLLRLIAERSRIPGEWIGLDPIRDAPLLDIGDEGEWRFVESSLIDRGLLRRQPFPTGRTQETNRGRTEVMQEMHSLTPAAWEALEPIGGGGVLGTCFVAMFFDRELQAAYDEGIRPAIEDDCGLRALRVDREEHNDDINDRILAGIRSAQCVVADFTGQRHGVYFEAGFALGLGRTVIWTCRADDLHRLHFDTNHRNHVVWTDPSDLRRKLAARIRATVALPARFADRKVSESLFAAS
jgi:hypothetical protein